MYKFLRRGDRGPNFRRRYAVVGLVAVLLAVGLTSVSVPASASTNDLLFTVRIAPQHAKGRCLTLETDADWDGEAGVPVIQWDCNGRSDQGWKFESIGANLYRIRNVAGNQCLGIAGSTAVPWVWQWTKCNGKPSQSWKFQEVKRVNGERMVRIESVGRPGQCWDVKGGRKTGATSNLDARARVQVYPCKRGTSESERNQIFFLTTKSNGGGWDSWTSSNSPATVVSLGDSYASGEGVKFNNTSYCHRHNSVYGPRYAAQVNKQHFFVACEGDETQEALDHQIPNLRASTSHYKYEEVLISIGGNDAGFVPGFECAYDFSAPNWRKFNQCIADLDPEGRLARVRRNIKEIYTQVLELEDRPQVYVFTYPIVFDGRDGACPNLNLVSGHEAATIDDINRRLNQAIRDTVATLTWSYGSRIKLVDVESEFSSRRGGTCNTDYYIRDMEFGGNGAVSGVIDSSSFHPTATGYGLYLSKLNQVRR